jgi:Fe-S-cluster-containing dehydrogenase component
MTGQAILVNLTRCTGCWTCSMSCKVAHDVEEGKWWSFVRTIGSGSTIDEPAGKWPDLHMSWMPVFTSECVMCGRRTPKGSEPYCCYNCPTGALTYGNLGDKESEISKHMEELRQKGYSIFQLPEWERTRAEIYYAGKAK